MLRLNLEDLLQPTSAIGKSVKSNEANIKAEIKKQIQFLNLGFNSLKQK